MRAGLDPRAFQMRSGKDKVALENTLYEYFNLPL
jgi:hypothetical protein